MSILTYVFVWVFVMYMFVRMTIHISMGFRHVHVCTNDYPYFCIWVFVMHISVQMTIYPLLLNGFSSMDMFVRMTIHFFWIGFRYVHVCTNDYPFLLNGFSSCTFLYGWLSISFELVFVMYMFVQMTTIYFWMDCRHLHFCTIDYHIVLNGLSSFTFLYEWLPFLFEWIFVICISVRMTTISFWMDCCHAHFCTNDCYFFLIRFSSCTFL